MLITSPVSENKYRHLRASWVIIKGPVCDTTLFTLFRAGGRETAFMESNGGEVKQTYNDGHFTTANRQNIYQ